jgi:drug/metabolite transporter (DMT)-like permease
MFSAGRSGAGRAEGADPLPLILLCVLGSMWGLSFSLSKLAVTGGIHPVAYAWMQSTGAALFLFVVCRIWRVPIPFSRAHIRLYAATAIIGLVLPNINIVTTTQYLPAGIVSTVVTTVPVITYLLALALGIERFQGRRAVGIALGFGGVLFIIGPEGGLPDPRMVPWVLLSLVTPVLYATNSILSQRWRPEGTHSLAAAFGMMLFASLASAPFMVATGSVYPLLANGMTVTDLAMLGQIAVTCVAYVFYFEIIRRAGPVYIGQVSYVVIVFGLFWGWVIFNENPSPWIFGAVACVLIGVGLVNRKLGKR